ncbi:MAG: hypothetical protein HUN05_12125 [Desulfobacter sp.]|nr:MAG: hypothetical protein HUN05_12125 [Desulfobacter sp.]
MKKCPQCEFEFENDIDCQVCGYTFDGTEQDVIVRSNRGTRFLVLVLLVGAAFLIWRPGSKVVETKTDGNYLAEATISNGEKIEINDHLIPGRYTLFLFYVDW